MSNQIELLIFFGAPLIIGIILIVFYIRANRSTSTDGITFYHFEVGGSKLVITKKALLFLGLILIPIFWLTWFLPGLFFIMLLLFSIFLILRPSHTTKFMLSDRSQSVINSLRDMQNQIEQARQQIELIATEIGTRQIEVEEKTRMTQALEDEVKDKLENYEIGNSLSDEQKKFVINAAKEAFSRKSAKQIISTVLVTILLNLTATFIWTLIGSPGRNELLSLFLRK